MALTPNGRLAELTNAIVSKTDDGTVNWERTSVEGVYGATLGNFVIHVSEELRPRSTDADYTITLYDSYGEVIERFSDPDLSGQTAEGHSGFYASMRHLYRSAAQQASGANEAIDAILKILKES